MSKMDSRGQTSRAETLRARLEAASERAATLPPKPPAFKRPAPIEPGSLLGRPNTSRIGKSPNAAMHSRPGVPSKFFQMAGDRQFSPLQKGTIAELAVTFRLALHGLSSYTATADGDTTDVVVELPTSGKLIKIQVKWGRWYPRRPIVHFCLTRSLRGGVKKRYKPGAFDFLVGYDIFDDVAYVYAASELDGISTAVGASRYAAERWDKIISLDTPAMKET